MEDEKEGKYKSASYSHNPAILCSPKDVVPLSHEQYEILDAVASNDIRYNLYLTGKLAWGLQLKVGDRVQVKLPKRRPSLQLRIPQYAAAIVRWMGVVLNPYKDAHHYGVEIMVRW